MNRQRKVMITITYNEMGIIIDTKAEELDLSAQQEPDIIACGDCKHYICHDRRCGYWNHGVKPLEWCCHGEERNG